jgi:hypothetical protein
VDSAPSVDAEACRLGCGVLSLASYSLLSG